jgi:hypothetical protein
MRVTEDELIDIWYYFQYCCLPSIIMARYAYFDYINDIKDEKMFYRHERKQAINKVGKYLDGLPRKLMDVSNQNIRYMNILGDNIDEIFEDEKEELHKAIYLSFKNGKWKHVDCFTAIHYISAMLNIAEATYIQCCKDMLDVWCKDPTEVFHVFNLHEVNESWEKIADTATEFFAKDNKKATDVNLHNIRCDKAIDAFRRKYADVETLKEALKKSYKWSPNYQEGVAFEDSKDYLIINNNQNQEK